jgi:hypothetical protein
MQTIADNNLLADVLASVLPPGRPVEGGGDEAPPAGDEDEEETPPS